MTMYIQTQNQYAQFESDELTDLLGQINFTINKFGLWQSDHDTKANYITDDIEIVYKERKAQLEGACQEQGRLQNRLRAVSAAMEHMTAAMTEWDEEVIHQLLEKVTVLSREKIRVTFRDGRKIEQ